MKRSVDSTERKMRGWKEGGRKKNKERKERRKKNLNRDTDKEEGTKEDRKGGKGRIIHYSHSKASSQPPPHKRSEVRDG